MYDMYDYDYDNMAEARVNQCETVHNEMPSSWKTRGSFLSLTAFCVCVCVVYSYILVLIDTTNLVLQLIRTITVF